MGNGNSDDWKDGYQQAIRDAIREASKPAGRTTLDFETRRQIIVGRIKSLSNRKIKEKTND